MNKKIVVIVVIVECVLAVLLVSFLGKAIENYRTDVLTKDIYFTNEAGEKIADGAALEVELSDSDISYRLYWVAVDDRVTEKSVEFSSSKPDKVTVDNTGLVTFFVETDVEITIKATYGS